MASPKRLICKALEYFSTKRRRDVLPLKRYQRFDFVVTSLIKDDISTTFRVNYFSIKFKACIWDFTSTSWSAPPPPRSNWKLDASRDAGRERSRVFGCHLRQKKQKKYRKQNYLECDMMETHVEEEEAVLSQSQKCFCLMGQQIVSFEVPSSNRHPL